MKSSIRPLGIITVSIFGFLMILTMYNNKSELKMTAKEMHAGVIMTNYVLNEAGVSNLENALLIDIRASQAFIISHQTNAINIPLASILDEEFQSIWASPRPKLLLSNDPVKAHEAWMLLTQLGVAHLFVAGN